MTRLLCLYRLSSCGSAGKESACKDWRPGFDPWIGKIPWRRERLPTPVFWPGEVHGLYSPWGHSQTQLSDFHFSFHDSRAASFSVAPPFFFNVFVVVVVVPLLFYATKFNLCWAITNRQRVCLVVTAMASLGVLSGVSSRFYSEHHLSLKRAAGP